MSEMLKRDLLPWYLQNLDIRGFDDDSKKKEKKDDKSDDSDDEDEEDEDDDDDGGDAKDDKGKDKDTNTDGLKSALRKERNDRKKLDRELKALKKKLEEKDDKDTSDADKAKNEAASATSKATKLAGRLRDAAIDNAVIKVASKLKFRDIDDALALVKRDDIDVEQDEEEPEDVEVDAESVMTALKDLAKRKPHLIVAEGQGDKSGSKFGGGRKSQEDADEETLAAKYPALARGRIARQASASK